MARRLMIFVLVLMTLAGCASGRSHEASRSSSASPSQVRCLNDPNEGPTRPLIFLFCIQSP